MISLCRLLFLCGVDGGGVVGFILYIDIYILRILHFSYIPWSVVKFFFVLVVEGAVGAALCKITKTICKTRF